MDCGEASATLKGTYQVGVALIRRTERSEPAKECGQLKNRIAGVALAWRPVVFQTQTGGWRVVWLRYLQRGWSEGIHSGLGPRWVYRSAQSKQ